MSRKYKIRDQEKLHFVTFTVIRWLDVFTRQDYRDIFLDSIRYCQKHKGLELYAYVIMSNHVHMILGRHGDEGLEGIIRDIKKYTSVKITQAIRKNLKESRRELFMWLFEKDGIRNPNNKRYQFWQQHNHPLEISTDQSLINIKEYIHQNPVKAGIVSSPEHYVYSSARNYKGLPGTLIDVILI